MISSENALMYVYALWLIGRRDFGVDLQTLRGVIARWFFMAHTTGRYTAPRSRSSKRTSTGCATSHPATASASSPSSTAIVRDTFTTDYWEITLPNRLDTSAAEVARPVGLLGRAEPPRRRAALQRSSRSSQHARSGDHADPRASNGTTSSRRHTWHALGITDDPQVNAIANIASSTGPTTRRSLPRHRRPTGR